VPARRDRVVPASRSSLAASARSPSHPEPPAVRLVPGCLVGVLLPSDGRLRSFQTIRLSGRLLGIEPAGSPVRRPRQPDAWPRRLCPARWCRPEHQRPDAARGTHCGVRVAPSLSQIREARVQPGTGRPHRGSPPASGSGGTPRRSSAAAASSRQQPLRRRGLLRRAPSLWAVAALRSSGLGRRDLAASTFAARPLPPRSAASAAARQPVLLPSRSAIVLWIKRKPRQRV
jgi:hypothetical protein